MQNGRGDLEIRFRSLLVAQHPVSDQGQIDPAQPLRRDRQHLLVGCGVIQIHHPCIDRGRAAGQ